MKKRSLLAGLIFSMALIALSSASVEAQSPSLRPAQIRNQEIRDAQQNFREEGKTNLQERNEAVRKAQQEFRSNRAKIHAARLQRRFEFYQTRLNAIATRIQNRINTLSAQGKDTTAAQVALNSGKTKLAEAVRLGAQAVAAFNAITPESWAEQKEEVQAAKDLAAQARRAFVDAHKLFTDAVKALRV